MRHLFPAARPAAIAAPVKAQRLPAAPVSEGFAEASSALRRGLVVQGMRGTLLLSVASVVALPAYAQQAGADVGERERAGTIIVTGVRSDDATAESGGLVIPVTQAGPLGPTLAKDLPFATTSIPQVIIQDQQAHTPDEALKNDPSSRHPRHL